ncbi:hypothetical protein ACWF0M_12610 [Kribbella sp. NPDC055110]
MATFIDRVESRDDRVVRLWFGEYCISELKAEPKLAGRYVGAWRSRFPGLRITDDPAELAPAVRP